VAGYPAAADLVQIQEAKRAHPVVDRYNHHIAACGKRPSVVDGRRAGPDHETPAVNPDHDGTASVVSRRCPDIQVEAVFTLRLLDALPVRNHFLVLRRVLGQARGDLGGGVAKFSRRTHVAPRLNRLWGTPTEIPDGRGREWYPSEDRKPVLRDSLHSPGIRLVNYSHVLPPPITRIRRDGWRTRGCCNLRPRQLAPLYSRGHPRVKGDDKHRDVCPFMRT
jgi:hypothetical protein